MGAVPVWRWAAVVLLSAVGLFVTSVVLGNERLVVVEDVYELWSSEQSAAHFDSTVPHRSGPEESGPASRLLLKLVPPVSLEGPR